MSSPSGKPHLAGLGMPGRCAACCCHCCRPHAAAAAAVGRRTPRTETSPCRCATCSGGTPSSAAAPPRGRPSPSGCPLRPPLPGGGLHPGRRRAEAAAAERRWRRQRLPRNTLASSLTCRSRLRDALTGRPSGADCPLLADKPRPHLRAPFEGLFALWATRSSHLSLLKTFEAPGRDCKYVGAAAVAAAPAQATPV